MSTEESISTPLWLRTFRRVLDSGPVWGSFLAQSGRYGAMTYRLTVYPPGVSVEQRRMVRLWQLFPLWGGITWVTFDVVLQQLTNPWLALALATGATAWSGVATFRAAGPARAQVRRVYASTLAGFDDDGGRSARNKIMYLAATMTDADRRHRQNQISSVAYELVWWNVYEQLHNPHFGTDSNAQHRSYGR